MHNSLLTSQELANYSDADLLTVWLSDAEVRSALSASIAKSVQGNPQRLDASDFEHDVIVEFYRSLPSNLRELLLSEDSAATRDAINYFSKAAKHKAFPHESKTKERWHREAVSLEGELENNTSSDALAYRDAYASVVANETLFRENSRFLHAIAMKVDGYTEHEIAPLLGWSNNKMLNRALKSDSARQELFAIVWPYLSESLCSDFAADYETWLFGVGEESESARAAMEEHLSSCDRCNSAHQRNQTYLRAHSLLLPVPAAYGLENADGFVAGMWHSITSRFAELTTAFTANTSSGNWQSAKPLAAGAAVIMLVGGSTYVATNKDAERKLDSDLRVPTFAVPQTSAAPKASGPAKRAERAARKKSGSTAAPQETPRAVAPANPVQQPQVDDGSSEFLPEAR